MSRQQDVSETIENLIKNNDVVLFLKGTAEEPQCGFSFTIVRILRYLNIKFQDIDVLTDNEMREGIKSFSDWSTIPQLYIKGDFVGGCDIVKEMFDSGELIEFLEKKGISFSCEE
ncbi:MAG: Grx4 family monothiol glutaredoxin [Pseudanabaenaceae cyanobacterium bins.39]|nr:Grx4 family monothiol glutaredoxin [Pseudanabaenaceae cyanobacterium bins.39]